MERSSLKRRSRRLYEVADRVTSADVAKLLRQYAGELAMQARARSRQRRIARVARVTRAFGLFA